MVWFPAFAVSKSQTKSSLSIFEKRQHLMCFAPSILGAGAPNQHVLNLSQSIKKCIQHLICRLLPGLDEIPSKWCQFSPQLGLVRNEDHYHGLHIQVAKLKWRRLAPCCLCRKPFLNQMGILSFFKRFNQQHIKVHGSGQRTRYLQPRWEAP